MSDSGRYPLSKSMGDGKRFFDHERRVVKFEFNARKNLSTSILMQTPDLVLTDLPAILVTTMETCITGQEEFRILSLGLRG